jgi:outer membrane protein TolC
VKIRTIVTALAATMSLVAPVGAQTPAPAAAPAIPLTLEDVVRLAGEASHRVREGVARHDGALAAAAGRSVADDPVVSVLGGYTRTNHVDAYSIPRPVGPPTVIYPDVPDNWRARLDVAWPLYTSGRVTAMTKAATADAEASSLDVTAVRADVRLDATRAYWQLAMAREAVRVMEESLRRVESHLRDVTNMRAVGLLAPNDVLSVEARRSRERVLLIEARNARDVAEADLRRATGLPPAAVIDIAVPADVGVSDPADLTQLLDEAKGARVERQALDLRARALGDRRQAAAAATRPLVSVVGGVDIARPNPRIFPRAAEWNPSFDVGFNVSWSVWDSGRAKAEMSEADAGRRAAEARLAEFDRHLEFELTQRRLDVRAALAAIEASDDGVRAAAEAHRVVVERFKAGLVTNTEVLDAQLALMTAQLDRTRAVTAARLAAARLDRARGR